MTIPKIIERARPDILAMKAYASARSMIADTANLIFLDANECAYEPYSGAGELNRYPAQQPADLRAAMAGIYGVAHNQILITRGADEAIDVLIRAYCTAGQDRITICPPAFPMYAQAAGLQGAAIDEVPLNASWMLDVPAILRECLPTTKIVFICSPNNPTGNSMAREDILQLCRTLADKCLVVVDETYCEYAQQESLTAELQENHNLVVLRTISKAYAAAGLRCGAALAHHEIIALLGKVLAPYPLPRTVVRDALKILEPKNVERLRGKISDTLVRRDRFIADLKKLPFVRQVFPSDANFILVEFTGAEDVMMRTRAAGIILRNQSHNPRLSNCIRISIGADDDMARLLCALKGEEWAGNNDRRATFSRATKETKITATINLDQSEPVRIQTGIGFYDHMLEQIARHGGFSLTLDCIGDLDIDNHHTIEDCAIVIGQLLKKALGDKAGIGRYGFTVPMDEALASVALDLSGRFFLKFEGDFPDRAVGDFPSDMTAHVFRSLAENLQATCHIKVEGENTHHMIEGCFKAFGRALRQAIRREGDAVPSSKGVLA